MTNTYSTQWFDTFLAPVPSAQTEREIQFLVAHLPQATHPTILDICCGRGRHARELSQRGYCVTGLDVNEYVLEYARRVDSRSRYVHGDMRALDASLRRAQHETFDAVLILWQSFGHFDDATNEHIVKQIAALLKLRGKLILDIYNREFFENHQGERVIRTEPRRVLERKWLRGNRIFVELDYGDARDEFEWQIFYPDEISALAARFGLNEILRCANFEENSAPSPEIPRMQFVFQKP
ncbi:MAG: class I SAM-dependent methyltransferase [Chloroflexi bacterium]|nr:class I SAM-dependent methyltransferase [Chloroflexota bacterium]